MKEVEVEGKAGRGALAKLRGQFGAEIDFRRETNSAPGWEITTRVRGEEVFFSDLKLENLIVDSSWKGQELSIPPMEVSLANGKATGSAGFDFAGNTVKYEAAFQAIDMNSLARGISPEARSIGGKLEATVAGEETWTEENSRKGKGRIKIEEGDLWHVPVFWQLARFLKTLRLPGYKEGAFREVEGSFWLTEEGIHTDDLRAKAGELGLLFRGKMSYEGELNFLVVVELGRDLLKKVPAIGGIASAILQKTTGSLLGIKIGGSVKAPTYKVAPLSRLRSILGEIEKCFEGNHKQPEKKTRE